MHENFADTGGLFVPKSVRSAVQATVDEHKHTHKGFMPPTHQHSGMSTARAGVGLPGHCAYCAIVGHVVAHPDYGCPDVHCNDPHDEETA